MNFYRLKKKHQKLIKQFAFKRISEGQKSNKNEITRYIKHLLHTKILA